MCSNETEMAIGMPLFVNIFNKSTEIRLIKYHGTKEYSISEIVKMSGISQATLYRYIQKQGNRLENTINPANEKIAQILMSLRVENNNKFVRGE